MKRALQPMAMPLSRRSREGDASIALPGFRHVLRNGWLIAGVACAIASFAIAVALGVKPVYESNILIQITRNAPPSADVQTETPAITEIEILRSRSILARVVNALHLDIAVEPTLFPVVGAFIARSNPGLSEPGLFGVGGYVWGNEQVRVDTFNVPDALLEQPFHLVVSGPDTLSQQEAGIRMHGKVGQQSHARLLAGPLDILVSHIHARPGAAFTLYRSRQGQAVDRLQRSLAIAEKGRLSNVIGVSLQGGRPELVSRILNEIGDQYIQQQTTQKNDEVKNQLVFYDQQVAQAQRRIRELDARLDELLQRHGASDLSEDARILAQQSLVLQAELTAKEQQKIALSGRAGDRHPEMLVVTRHIASIRHELADIEARRKGFGAAQQEILAVNRDKLAHSQMIFELLNTRHKLDALMLSNHVNVRVVDRAQTPLQSVTLGLPVMLVLACLLGLAGGVGASVLKNALVRRKHRGSAAWGVRRLAIGTQAPLDEGNVDPQDAEPPAAEQGVSCPAGFSPPES
jgi:tyrosine-protein kinase Etk/Wzc